MWEVDGVGVHAEKRSREGGIGGTTSYNGSGRFIEDHVTRNTISSKHLLQIVRTTWWVGTANEAQQKAAKAHRCPNKQGLCFALGGQDQVGPSCVSPGCQLLILTWPNQY
jgi:hypothetical protein